MADWNTRIIDEFRRNGGVVGGPFEGRPLLLLHSVGARTGRRRLTPLMYQEVGGGAFAVFGSYAGSDSHPAWFHNLVANPNAMVEVGREEIAVVARVTSGEERTAIWERQKREYPFFAEYEARTDRTIPVMVLEPTDGGPSPGGS